MIATDTPAVLIVDPINILYATGASNMTVWSSRTQARYLLLFAEGPVVLYDFFGCEHLAQDLPTIDQIRPARGLCFTSSNDQTEKNAKKVAAEIHSLMKQHVGTERRLAVDRFSFAFTDALRAEGLLLSDADPVFYHARKNKLVVEIAYMREAMRRVETAVESFYNAVTPGKTESEVWAEFYKGLISGEGQYIATWRSRLPGYRCPGFSWLRCGFFKIISLRRSQTKPPAAGAVLQGQRAAGTQYGADQARKNI